VVEPEEVSQMSTAFKRWQDWTIVAIGIVVLATPFVFGETSNGNAAYSAYIMGALVAVAGLAAAFMATPAKAIAWIVALLGVVLFFAPWLFGFTAVVATSWVSWIAGVLVVGVTGFALLGEQPRRTVTT
jgi:SPW repeat-containing protein